MGGSKRSPHKIEEMDHENRATTVRSRHAIWRETRGNSDNALLYLDLGTPKKSSMSPYPGASLLFPNSFAAHPLTAQLDEGWRQWS
jgi:hypothetical protein